MSSIKNLKSKDPNDKTPFILRPQMQLIHDQYLECIFINWYTSKDNMVEPTCELFLQWKEKEKPVTYLWMEEAGENHLLEMRLNSLH